MGWEMALLSEAYKAYPALVPKLLSPSGRYSELVLEMMFKLKGYWFIPYLECLGTSKRSSVQDKWMLIYPLSWNVWSSKCKDIAKHATKIILK